MNRDLIPLSPPSPFRQRVVAPIFFQDQSVELNRLSDECLSIARQSDGFSPYATSWTEQLIKLQKLGKLPQGADGLILYAELGVACAKVEQDGSGFVENRTTYFVHACLAMFAFDEDKSRQMLQSLAIDGSYYLVRSKLSADAVGESLLNAFA